MIGDHPFWIKDYRVRWLSLSLFLVAVPFLTCLSDACSFDPARAYLHAQQTFLRGYLEAAQGEAERGYQRSLASDPEWSRRFQVLEATAMVWRGADEELLQLFAGHPNGNRQFMQRNDGQDIEQAALEATALIRLGRMNEAALKLKAGDALCAGMTPFVECGAILRAHGKFYLAAGRFEEAEETYRQTLDFARVHKDRLLEGTALLNLATTISKRERHDEAPGLYIASYEVAAGIGAGDLAQIALEGEGWEYYTLGDFERALDLQQQSAAKASELGDTQAEIQALTVTALVYGAMLKTEQAENADLQAIELARRSNHQSDIANASMDLAQLYLMEGRASEADRYTSMALSIIKKDGDPLDILTCQLLTGESAALRQDWSSAEPLLREVSASPNSQEKMKWAAEYALANMYVAQGQVAAADEAYKSALAVVEGARRSLKHEASQLPFLTNAARIYDDYIHFLVEQGRTDEALEAADWSRARTLQQGLGVIPADTSLKPPPLRAKDVARQTNATLLFYWLGEKQSYLWAVSPEKTKLLTLPAKSEIVTKMQRYRRTLLALKDPLRENNRQGDKDGRELYEMLVAPIAEGLSPGRSVVLFTDGEMSQLNFETLIAGSPSPHYWIEDATVSSAPSIRLLAGKDKSASAAHDRLLLLGDSLPPDPTLPHLPMAEVEVRRVEARFSADDKAIFAGERATPLTYLKNRPEQFAYIHFVAHASASSTDPLDSAVILSRDNSGEDSYKLFARDILQHPISAKLVTISACNSSGMKSYAGEGVVGLSWAFLRAGAHNTIGALWDVSDASTPELMDRLYAGLQANKPPAAALREAKLSLLHSNNDFSRPFYWAPFQLYSGH